jgi:hypothetical protein
VIYIYVGLIAVLIAGLAIAAIAGRRGAEVERLQARIEHLERVRAILERRIENLLGAKRR